MKKSEPSLGHRERQIMDAVYRLGEASVGDVRAILRDPPSYSSVRKMLSLLEAKGLLRHRREGVKYIYRTVRSRESARHSALKHLLTTFFGGSASDAVAAIIDTEAEQLSEDDLKKIELLIERARHGET